MTTSGNSSSEFPPEFTASHPVESVAPIDKQTTDTPLMPSLDDLMLHLARDLDDQFPEGDGKFTDGACLTSKTREKVESFISRAKCFGIAFCYDPHNRQWFCFNWRTGPCSLCTRKVNAPGYHDCPAPPLLHQVKGIEQRTPPNGLECRYCHSPAQRSGITCGDSNCILAYHQECTCPKDRNAFSGTCPVHQRQFFDITSAVNNSTANEPASVLERELKHLNELLPQLERAYQRLLGTRFKAREIIERALTDTTTLIYRLKKETQPMPDDEKPRRCVGPRHPCDNEAREGSKYCYSCGDPNFVKAAGQAQKWPRVDVPAHQSDYHEQLRKAEAEATDPDKVAAGEGVPDYNPPPLLNIVDDRLNPVTSRITDPSPNNMQIFKESARNQGKTIDQIAQALAIISPLSVDQAKSGIEYVLGLYVNGQRPLPLPLPLNLGRLSACFNPPVTLDDPHSGDESPTTTITYADLMELQQALTPEPHDDGLGSSIDLVRANVENARAIVEQAITRIATET